MSELMALLVWPYLFLFLLLAYTLKDKLKFILSWFSKLKWKTRYTVFLIATLTGVLYYATVEVSWVDLVITYCVGTSLYELLFTWIEINLKKLKNKLWHKNNSIDTKTM